MRQRRIDSVVRAGSVSARLTPSAKLRHCLVKVTSWSDAPISSGAACYSTATSSAPCGPSRPRPSATGGVSAKALFGACGGRSASRGPQAANPCSCPGHEGQDLDAGRTRATAATVTDSGTGPPSVGPRLPRARWTPDEVALLGTAPHAVTAAQIPPCGSRGSACSKPDRFPGFPRAGLKKLAGPAGGRPGPSVGTSPPPAGRTSRVAGSGRRRLRRVCFVPEALLSLPCFPLRFPPCLFSTVGRENRSASCAAGAPRPIRYNGHLAVRPRRIGTEIVVAQTAELALLEKVHADNLAGVLDSF